MLESACAILWPANPARKKRGLHPVTMQNMNQGRDFIFMILMALSMKWSAIPLNNAVASTGPVLEAF